MHIISGISLRWTLGALLTLAVAACSDELGQQEAGAAAPQGGKLSGEILGGSISDDMIELEALKSQSPPLARPPRPQAGENGAQDAPAPSR